MINLRMNCLKYATANKRDNKCVNIEMNTHKKKGFIKY